MLLNSLRRGRDGLALLSLALLVVCGADQAGSQAPETSWPGETWPTSTPATEGIDPEAIDALVADIGSGEYGLVDAFLLVRHGKVVADYRFTHDYEATGRVREVRDPEGGVWSYETSQDGAGWVTATSTTAEGNTIMHQDLTDFSGGYRTASTFPSGAESTYVRSPDRLSARQELACGMTVDYSYDLDPEYRYEYLTEKVTRSPSGSCMRSPAVCTSRGTSSRPCARSPSG